MLIELLNLIINKPMNTPVIDEIIALMTSMPITVSKHVAYVKLFRLQPPLLI